jgi:hypothetical protein
MLHLALPHNDLLKPQIKQSVCVAWIVNTSTDVQLVSSPRPELKTLLSRSRFQLLAGASRIDPPHVVHEI